MAITYKELKNTGAQAILELDDRGTSALIQETERQKWNEINNTYYGVCLSDTLNTQKGVNISNFVLRTGVIVAVQFINAVTPSDTFVRYLNVSNTGNYKMQYKGSDLSANMIPAGMVALFAFDGNIWQLLNPAFNSENKTMLVVSFGSYFAGKTVTIAGTGITSQTSLVVPDSLDLVVGMVETGKSCTVTCEEYTKTYTVTDVNGIYHGYFQILERNTWEEIATASAKGLAPVYWKVGDEKTFNLKSHGDITVQIYDFNHDDLADESGKAGITFGMKHLMWTTGYMDRVSTNANSFTGTCLYDWLQDGVWNMMPANLRGVIKSVNKKTSLGGGVSMVPAYNMSIFLFSEVECTGANQYSVSGEGYKYPIFTTDISRMKRKENGNGSEMEWWTRSPAVNTTNRFAYIQKSGTSNSSSPNGGDKGFCFGFCI